MPGGLLTDLYELNMAASYLRREMVGPATFSLFVRKLPRDRGYLIACGLADCLRFLEDFGFSADEVEYLRGTGGYDEETLRALAGLRFTGDVWAVPEGCAVFPGEPLLEVTAPIAEAQLVETVLLNHLTFQTSIATKAARCVQAAAGAQVIDFSFRRTHGVEAGLAVARASAIAGFVGTSNVEAARRYAIPAVGTMAHSFIEAFPEEETAFAAFAADFPDRTTYLVDTYDTLDGVRNAIAVSRRLNLGAPAGVRLDSGDLGTLAVQSRLLLDEAGMTGTRIVASGGLDEFAIAELTAIPAPIDIYGVGTKMGVSADAPYLDSAYKLVAFGDRPVMKLSTGKVTAPGAKQIYRGAEGDIVALREEPAPAGYRPLLVPVMRGGRRLEPPEPLTTIRDRCAAEVSALPGRVRRLRSPGTVPVRLSDQLALMHATLQAELAARLGPRRASV